jgi:hypothetical protein
MVDDSFWQEHRAQGRSDATRRTRRPLHGVILLIDER